MCVNDCSTRKAHDLRERTYQKHTVVGKHIASIPIQGNRHFKR